MNKVNEIKNELYNENLYSVKLNNGLSVYICKKQGYNQKIALFGTKYGSLYNEFIDISNQKKLRVPDGVAHFLEHKLFEQEGENALDLFSKIGVSANAYTSFDQTVFYFETIEKYEEALALLIKLIKTPYFTDKNVEKEKGIIAQEINMYKDDANYIAYFNTIKAMYINNPVNIDIAGSIESIAKINKEILNSCYNTFYNPNNMFLIVLGDIDIERTLKLIEDNIRLYEKDFNEEKRVIIQKFEPEEPKTIKIPSISENMDIYMPEICIGYKLDVVKKEEIIKRVIITDIIEDMFFSKISELYKQEYDKGLIYEEINLYGEFTENFSHVIINAESKNLDKLETDIIEYVEKIKKEDIDQELFDTMKKKKIGEILLESDNLNSVYRRIIDSILTNTSAYLLIDILDNLKSEDIKEFLSLLNSNNRVVSKINSK